MGKRGGGGEGGGAKEKIRVERATALILKIL
jgi:hypothetical protein